MSSVGKLFGGEQSQTVQARQTVKLADFLNDIVESIPGRAEELSLQEYQPYEEQRFADFTPDQLAAFQGIRDMQGAEQQSFDNARNFANQMGGISLDDISKYMSPYMQDVVDIERREAIRSADQQRLQLEDQQRKIGAFGGDRTAIANSELNRNTSQLLSDIQSRGLQSAYDRAIQTAALNQNALANAAGTNLNVGTSRQQNRLQELAGLENIGQAQQGLDQRQLDFDYGQFVEDRNWDYQNLDFLNRTVLPIADLTKETETNTTSTSQTTPGIGQVAAGIAMSAMGLPGMGGVGASSGAGGGLQSLLQSGTPIASPNSFMGMQYGMQNYGGPASVAFKDGGVVKKYKEGGFIEGLSGAASKIKDFFRDYPVTRNIQNKLFESIDPENPAIKAGNALAEFAIENPVEAASTAAMAIPFAGPASKLAATAGKGVGGLSKIFPAIRGAGKSALNLVKTNPSTASGAIGLGAYLGNEIGERAAGENDGDPIDLILDRILTSSKPEMNEESDFVANPDAQNVAALVETIKKARNDQGVVKPAQPTPQQKPDSPSQEEDAPKEFINTLETPSKSRREMNVPLILAGLQMMSGGDGVSTYLNYMMGENQLKSREKEALMENALGQRKLEQYSVQNELTAANQALKQSLLPLETRLMEAQIQKTLAEATSEGNTQSKWQKTYNDLLEGSLTKYSGTLSPERIQAEKEAAAQRANVLLGFDGSGMLNKSVVENNDPLGILQ